MVEPDHDAQRAALRAGIRTLYDRILEVRPDESGFYPAFWPKEEMLRGWMSAAFSEAGYCSAWEAVAEVGLGVEGPDEERCQAELLLRTGRPSARYDLLVSSGRLRGACRSFSSFRPFPRLIVELKALNAAGKLKRGAMVMDLWKLDIARRYWLTEHAAAVGTLMVVVATSKKDATSKEEDFQRQRDVARWILGAREEADCPRGVPVVGLFSPGVGEELGLDGGILWPSILAGEP